MKHIDTQAEIDILCKDLSQEKQIAIDLEFIRENSFIPKLCLIQIATAQEIYIIDPFKLEISSILKIFSDPNILKIMHSATQDIDVCYKNFSIIPFPIFDTQIASGFLGYGDSISYAKLVKDITNVNINKNCKLTNWQQRPLSNAQFEYAAIDVEYLFALYHNLSQRLIKEQRKNWYEEEITNIYHKESYEINPENAWKKIATPSNKPLFLSYLKELSKLREEIAIKNNKPRKSVMRNETIIKLANLQPTTKTQIINNRILKNTVKTGLIDKIIKIPEKIKNHSDATTTILHKNLQIDTILLDYVKLYLKFIAQKYNIAAKYITTSSEVSKHLANKDYEAAFLKGWRYDIFGKNLQKLVSGELSLNIQNNKVEIS